MKCIIKFLCTVLLLTSIFSVPAKANPWLVLEGVNLGFQVLKEGVEKIKDSNNKKKRTKNNQAKKNTVTNFSGFACVYPVITTAQYSPEIIYRGENTFSVVMNNIAAKSCSPGTQYLILKSNYPIQFSKLEKYAGKNISKKELLNIIEGTLLHKMVSNTLSTQKLNNKIVTNKIKQKKKVTKQSDWRKEFELVQQKKK